MSARAIVLELADGSVVVLPADVPLEHVPRPLVAQLGDADACAEAIARFSMALRGAIARNGGDRRDRSRGVELVERTSAEQRSYDVLYERMRAEGFARDLKSWAELTPLERATWRARCAATRVLIDEALVEPKAAR